MEIIDFRDKYFDSMADCYKIGFPRGYNRYALSRLVRHQKDTVFLAIEQELVVGVLIGITNYGEAWFSGLTVLPEQHMQKCALRLACAVANRFVNLGFTKVYFTTERRSVLGLAKLVSVEKIVEKPDFYFDGAKRWLITANISSLPKLIKLSLS